MEYFFNIREYRRFIVFLLYSLCIRCEFVATFQILTLFAQLETIASIFESWFWKLEGLLDVIRPTASWPKYRSYLQTVFKGFSAKYCSHPNAKGDYYRESTCSAIKITLKKLSNLAKYHCDVKEDECKDYCQKYCDHFSGNPNGKYFPYCPRGTSNRTEQLLPTNKDIDGYLERFIAGKNCRES